MHSVVGVGDHPDGLKDFGGRWIDGRMAMAKLHGQVCAKRSKAGQGTDGRVQKAFCRCARRDDTRNRISFTCQAQPKQQGTSIWIGEDDQATLSQNVFQTASYA